MKPTDAGPRKTKLSRRRLIFRVAGLILLGCLISAWSMIRLTVESYFSIGARATIDTFGLLSRTGHYNRIINLKVDGSQDDPFGPALQALEAKRGRGGATSSDFHEMGNLYLRRGEVEKASAALEKSREIAGDSYALDLDLGLAYLRLGENDNCAHGSMAKACLFPVERTHDLPQGTARAGEMFERALGRKDTLQARWLLNLTHQLLGTFPDSVPVKYRIAIPVSRSTGALPSFTNISREAGTDNSGAGRGCAMGDFDGDGLLDIITAGNWGPLTFHHNEGDGRFTDWTERSGLSKIRNTFILVAADYDNDGLLDLYATRLFMWGAFPNVLLHNEGGGRFREVTMEAGVTSPGASMSAAWGDYNNDGFVDLFVTNVSDIAPLPFDLNPLSYLGKTPTVLYRNNGDGTFTDVTKQAGVEMNGVCLGTVWGDYNGDGWPDLFASQFFGLNKLFRNNGDGTFSDVAHEAGVQKPFTSFTSWFFDYDGDGRLDLLSTAWAPLQDSLEGLLAGKRDQRLSMQLYRNRGDGTFENKTVAAGLDRAHGTMAGNFGDIDNDGFPDFVLGTGSPELEYIQPNAVYHNNGDGTFSEVAAALHMGVLQKGHGVAFGDLFGSGRQDIYFALGGGYPGDGWFNALYRNEGPAGNWFSVRLEGRKEKPASKGTNRAAIGARISLTASGRTRVAEVTGGSGFGSSALDQHFGLGTAATVERIEIFWPGSGTRQIFEGLPANRRIRVVEFENEYHEIFPSPTKGADLSPK